MGVLFQAGDELLWNPSPRIATLFLAQVRAVEEAVDLRSGIGDLIADEVAVDPSALQAFVSTIGQQLDPMSSTASSLFAAVFALSYGLLAATNTARPAFSGPVASLARRGEILISGRGRAGPIYEA